MVQDPPDLAPFGMLIEKPRGILFTGSWPRSLGYPLTLNLMTHDMTSWPCSLHFTNPWHGLAAPSLYTRPGFSVYRPPFTLHPILWPLVSKHGKEQHGTCATAAGGVDLRGSELPSSKHLSFSTDLLYLGFLATFGWTICSDIRYSKEEEVKGQWGFATVYRKCFFPKSGYLLGQWFLVIFLLCFWIVVLSIRLLFCWLSWCAGFLKKCWVDPGHSCILATGCGDWGDWGLDDVWSINANESLVSWTSGDGNLAFEEICFFKSFKYGFERVMLVFWRLGIQTTLTDPRQAPRVFALGGGNSSWYTQLQSFMGRCLFADIFALTAMSGALLIRSRNLAWNQPGSVHMSPFQPYPTLTMSAIRSNVKSFWKLL